MGPSPTGEICKMAKKVFGSFLIMLFSILIFLFFKTGAYKTVSTEKTSTPQLQLFYMENIGPYHEIIEKLKTVEEHFKKSGLSCKKTFGHFLSDPEITEHDKLVSHVGCAFTKEESPQVFSLPEGVSKKFFGLNLKGKICYKGSFKGSPSLTALKVYPKLMDMAQKDRIKLKSESLEIYYVNENKVTTEVYLCED